MTLLTVLPRLRTGNLKGLGATLTVDAMGVQFETRLNGRLAEHGLTGDADAERVLGAEIRNEIAREIKSAVLHQVLGKLDLEL
ncbi:hypothetical protein XH84_00025 [Bradyrhizobium nanningense]|nr:hypothetical protein XH84_00025 [Bradyrhizobium nanningense]